MNRVLIKPWVKPGQSLKDDMEQRGEGGMSLGISPKKRRERLVTINWRVLFLLPEAICCNFQVGLNSVKLC